MNLFAKPQVCAENGHMIMSEVHKPLKRKNLNVDTRFYHTSYLAHAHYACAIPDRIQEVRSIKVKSAEIPVQFHNFSLSLQNTWMAITNNTTGQLDMAVINDGEYTTISSLVEAINGEIVDLGITDLTLSVSEGRAVFTSDSGAPVYIIQFGVSLGGLQLLNPMDYKTKLGWALGFHAQRYTLASAGTITSEGLCSIRSLHYLFLAVDDRNTRSSGGTFMCPVGDDTVGNRNVLARIALDQRKYPFASLLVASEEEGNLITNTREYNGTVNIQNLDVQLLDEWGRLVQINGGDISFVLEITCE